MNRLIAVKGYRLKDGKLVKCHKHLPVNLRLQKQASQKAKYARGEAVGNGHFKHTAYGVAPDGQLRPLTNEEYNQMICAPEPGEKNDRRG